jgi:hypothetical protein
LSLEFALYRFIHHLGLILGRNAGEKLLLCLGDSDSVVRIPDLFREIIPRARLSVCGFEIVGDGIEVDTGEIGAPGR